MTDGEIPPLGETPPGLTLWTIYDHPLDHPDHFVARDWHAMPGGREPLPGDTILLADSLEGVRRLIPLHLYCMARSEGDDPTIVETWF